jgi:hypothetical protein
MKNLVINDIEIGTDGLGRFSLNDLHKAAGSGNDTKPSLFLRSDSVKKMTEILNAQNRAFDAVSIKRGRYTGGTWVSKELVYKYAMWVDAAFEVKVIQTFDQAQQQGKAIKSMQAINELVAKIESDKQVASFCGSELSKYKKLKKLNSKQLDVEVERIQLKLGFLK